MKTIGRCALLAFLLLATAAGAQVHPSLERGFKAEKTYQLGDLDTINLLNGNLIVRIPIGTPYPVGGSLSYGLALVYNSKAWDFQETYYQGRAYGQALPDRLSNAGMGWTLSLGRLLAPNDVINDYQNGQWTYIGPDGGQHVFYQGLHNVGTIGTDPCTSACYTRDGSYIRMSVSGANKVVELPDGTRQIFQKFTLANNATEWRLVEIRDRFEDGLADVSIGYSADANIWTITDKHGRQQTVTFEADPTGRYKRRLQSVKLAAFGTATPSTYTFSYLPPQTLGVPCGSNLPGWTSVTVPLLSSVFLPDGTTFGMTYYTPTSADTCYANGLLGNLVLPTRGKLHYTYRQHQLPVNGCSYRSWHSNTAGIATRQFLDAAGGDAGTWTYSSVLSPSPASPTAFLCDDSHIPFSPPAEELQVTVTTPLKDKTVNYFSVWPGAQFPISTAFDQKDYGLPFSKLPAADATGTRFLSTQTFNCDAAGNNCTAARSTYVRYERDTSSLCSTLSTPGPDCLNTNRRLASQRTVYHDDNGRYADNDMSGYDGFGHYRTLSTNGNFASGNQRTTFTNYNPGDVLPGSAWVLETFTDRTMTEGGMTEKVQSCFDPNTGYLQRQRTYAGTNPGAQDVLVINTPDNAGNTIRQEWYGADGSGQSLSLSTNLCNLGLPASNAYRLDHTYQYGTLKSSQYKDAAGNANGTLAFKNVDQDVDFRTGLVSTSRDMAGIATNFTYDAMKRLRTAKPQTAGKAWEEYTYVNAAAGVRGRVEVRSCSPANTTTCAPLAQSQTEFDDLGRVSKERQLMADGTWSKRVTTYDLAGNKASISELQSDATADGALAKTSFSGYDPFGRPGTITPPDGANHAVTLLYAGARTRTRVVSVGTGTLNTAGNIPESSISKTEVYDRQGRLLQVSEPSGPGGSTVMTEYSYDAGGRVGVAKTTAPEGTQFRYFNYDGRGFLTSETHPEKGNVQTRYSNFDPKGHAGRIEDPVGGPNDRTYFYDRAGRPTQVWEAGPSGRKLKEFTYASANGASNLKNGKLEQDKRLNYLVLGTTSFTVEISQTYTYGGPGGLVSRRDLQLVTNGVAGESFTQGFDYNPLGQVSSLDYPRCTHAACTQPAAALFADVPVGSANQREIEAIYPGVTAGCGTAPDGRPNYCPNSNITRQEMAVFLLLAKEGSGYTPPACVTPMFNDVACSSSYAPWVNELARRGITSGCGGGAFCPTGLVSNAQMSIFLLTTLIPGYQPPACASAPFGDVACGYWAGAWIAEESRRGFMVGCGGGNFCPDANITRGQMAGMIARTFNFPLKIDPTTQRVVQTTYSNGHLTAVPGYASSVSYYANGMLNQVVHGNGVTDSQGLDATNWLTRPSSIAASGPYASWSTGTYRYDGAGNLTKAGTDWFQYDGVSRLVRGVVHDGTSGGGNEKQQAYTYDTYGNLTSTSTTAGGTTQTRNTPVNWSTNRLTGTATYDAAGNLTGWNGAVYQYDKFNQMQRMQNGAEEWLYIYAADDERLWSYKTDGTYSRWTLRDLDGRVLREYKTDSRGWGVAADYIYRDGSLLAAETTTGQRHYHLDHLGTPRLITRGSGYPAAYHVYYPYGEEATAFNQDSERMKFTGHERDLASLAGPADDLDYMHARHHSPLLGRFLGVDPVEGNPASPQSWNRYSYVMGNPLKFIDPSGMVANCGTPVASGSGGYATVLCVESEVLQVNDSDCDNICQVARNLERMQLPQFGNLMTKVFYGEMAFLMPTLLMEGAPIIELGLDAEPTIWNYMRATQPVYDGTVIPRSFELATENGKVWVHGNATEHMAEYATAMLRRGVGQEMVNLGTQAQLTSLRAAVQTATADGVPLGRLINVGGWELRFEAPRALGQLPALIHALPIP